jgi:hypothetical protein
MFCFVLLWVAASVQSRTYVSLSTFKVSATGFSFDGAVGTGARGREEAGLRPDFLVAMLGELLLRVSIPAITQLRVLYQSNLQPVFGASEVNSKDGSYGGEFAFLRKHVYT